MIEFHLDGRSGVAPYLQLIHQVRHALRLGLLHKGDQLPKVKDVAAPALGDAATDAAKHLKEPAQQAAESVKDTAVEAREDDLEGVRPQPRLLE